MIKQPVVAKCESIGLHGCDHLADAVVQYAIGDKTAAATSIDEAADTNDREQVLEFATALSLLTSIPGLAQYTQPIHEIAEHLRKHVAKGGGVPRKTPPSAVASSAIPSQPETVAPVLAKTSTEIIGRLRAGTVAPLSDERGAPCQLKDDPAHAMCIRSVMGPVVVTDIHAGPECWGRIFVSAGAPELPSWYVRSGSGTGLDIHGAALVVAEGVPLIIGVAPLPAQKGAPVHVDAACSVTWAAQRP